MQRKLRLAEFRSRAFKRLLARESPVTQEMIRFAAYVNADPRAVAMQFPGWSTSSVSTFLTAFLAAVQAEAAALREEESQAGL